MPRKPKECEWCGNNLTDEEIKYPCRDGRGKKIDGLICDECFHEHYEWTCDRCCEYELSEFQDIWFVVFETTPGRDQPVQPGIYEITNFPYYGGPLIGEGYLYDSSLRLTKAKIDFEQGNYPCGHLCRRCANKLHLRQSKLGKKLQASRKD